MQIMTDFEYFVPEWPSPYLYCNDIKEYEEKLKEFWKKQDCFPVEMYY